MFPTQPSAYWLERIEAADVPCGPVNDFDTIWTDPQFIANETFFEYEHPQAGRVRAVRTPARFSRTHPELKHHAPGLGQQTDEVLRSSASIPRKSAPCANAKSSTDSMCRLDAAFDDRQSRISRTRRSGSISACRSSNNPEANARALVQGWFRTGDEGLLNEDCYLHLTGRIKDIIIRGGENIAPMKWMKSCVGIPQWQRR